MAETVIMPKLGFDMVEGTLVRWVILEGQPASKGNVLAEIETDKATVEVETPYSGIVARHLVKAGEIVPVNTPIAVITAPGEQPTDAGIPAAPSAAQITGAATPERAVGMSIPTTTAPLVEAGAVTDRVKATPLARRVAEEQGVDLKSFRGSGPNGRIIKKDVTAYLATLRVTPPPATIPLTPTPISSATNLPIPPGATSAMHASPMSAPADQITLLPRLRAAIGRRMTEAKQQVPHFYVTHAYDMTAVMSLRKQVNTLLPDSEKISVNDFVIKAVAQTLRQFPNLNASLQNDKVLRHGSVNIGVAVAIEGGLLTVVCHETDLKSLRQIASEVRSMVARARDGKVRPDDIEGSTFSVSNLGMFEVEHFIAIINPPEAAILAVGSVREVPVVKDGAILPGMRMNATLSVDHRVSDGVEAAQFLQALAKFLEEPLRLLV